MAPEFEKIGGVVGKKWIFFEKKLCSEMIPKGFPHHPHHLFRQNWTNYTPIWAHFVACMMEYSCILVIPCSENSVFLEKKIDPKRHPKTCKRLPTSSKCRNANHAQNAVHIRFTRILTYACIFRVGLCMDLHGAGLRNNFWRSKKRKNFDIFIIAQIGSKRHPTSSTSLFSPKIDQFYPRWSPFWGLHSEF